MGVQCTNKGPAVFNCIHVLVSWKQAQTERSLVFILFDTGYLISFALEDQTQMEWKPAGQPEHASLNQCQLIVANRCSGHPQQVVEIRFLCNVRALLC